MTAKDFQQFENGICTFKHCQRPMDDHERDVGFGVWDCPKPKVTPPERPRGKADPTNHKGGDAMGTKNTGVPCYDKAGVDEPLFVMRAQDLSSPAMVCEWIKWNIETAPPEKLRDALETALAMRAFVGKRKSAD